MHDIISQQIGNNHFLLMKSENIWKAALGLSAGTICPAPLMIAKLNPSYSVHHPRRESF